MPPVGAACARGWPGHSAPGRRMGRFAAGSLRRGSRRAARRLAPAGAPARGLQTRRLAPVATRSRLRQPGRVRARPRPAWRRCRRLQLRPAARARAPAEACGQGSDNNFCYIPSFRISHVASGPVPPESWPPLGARVTRRRGALPTQCGADLLGVARVMSGKLRGGRRCGRMRPRRRRRRRSPRTVGNWPRAGRPGTGRVKIMCRGRMRPPMGERGGTSRRGLSRRRGHGAQGQPGEPRAVVCVCVCGVVLCDAVFCFGGGLF